MHNNIHNNLYYLFSIVAIISIFSSCGGAPGLKKILNKQSPYEKYEQSLKEAGLNETALGREWIESGQRAIKDSLYIPLPFKESGYFRAEKPNAAGFRFKARRGEVLTIQVDVKSRRDTQMFIDLFTVEKSTLETKHLLSGDSSTYNLEYEIEEDQDYIIRLQPELLRGGHYTITVITKPAMAWPVQMEIRTIGSMYGVDRDGGRRRHEGIDIFAPKGTPALAAVEGRVTRVNENRLGGKVVWVTDIKRGQSLYYAHLDSQIVKVGQKVFPGDTIGLIGNTGNARTTPPHLHFGIYKYGYGAFDPAPFVFQNPLEPLDITVDVEQLGNWRRTSAKTSNLRTSPSTKSSILKQLPKHTPLMITGGIEKWLRVVLPDGTSGFLSSSLVEDAEQAIREELTHDRMYIWDSPNPTATPVANLEKDQSVAVLAQFDAFLLVRSSDGVYGWIPETSS